MKASSFTLGLELPPWQWTNSDWYRSELEAKLDFSSNPGVPNVVSTIKWPRGPAKIVVLTIMGIIEKKNSTCFIWESTTTTSKRTTKILLLMIMTSWIHLAKNMWPHNNLFQGACYESKFQKNLACTLLGFGTHPTATNLPWPNHSPKYVKARKLPNENNPFAAAAV